jgi:hypothetical protein
MDRLLPAERPAEPCEGATCTLRIPEVLVDETVEFLESGHQPHGQRPLIPGLGH